MIGFPARRLDRSRCPSGASGLARITALNSSSDARMTSGKSSLLPSVTQRSTAILKIAIPASDVSVAAASLTPCSTQVSASAEADGRELDEFALV